MSSTRTLPPIDSVAQGEPEMYVILPTAAHLLLGLYVKNSVGLSLGTMTIKCRLGTRHGYEPISMSLGAPSEMESAGEWR